MEALREVCWLKADSEDRNERQKEDEEKRACDKFSGRR